MHKVLHAALLALLLAALSPAQDQSQFDEAAEARVLTELNQSRAEAGVAPLNLDPKLTEAARKHVLLVAKEHELLHQFDGEPPLAERLKAVGVLSAKGGENVQMNSDVETINQQFLQSPGHRANMLNPAFTSVGIAVVRSGEAYWVTEDFAAEVPSLSVEETENGTAEAVAAEWNKAMGKPIKRVSVAGLRQFACETAAKGRLESKVFQQGDLPARKMIAFTTANPGSLPPDVDSLLQMQGLQAFAVGACAPQQDEPRYWVVMVFF